MSYSRHEITVARKQHHCCECSRVINKFDRYWVGAVRDEEAWSSYKACFECDLLWRWVSKLSYADQHIDAPDMGAGSLSSDLRDSGLIEWNEYLDQLISHHDSIEIVKNGSEYDPQVAPWAKIAMGIEEVLWGLRQQFNAQLWGLKELDQNIDRIVEQVKSGAL
jgi:hypothetical protein